MKFEEYMVMDQPVDPLRTLAQHHREAFNVYIFTALNRRSTSLGLYVLISVYDLPIGK